MMELDRPVEKISLAQYTALTLTGAFFRQALLVNPIEVDALLRERRALLVERVAPRAQGQGGLHRLVGSLSHR